MDASSYLLGLGSNRPHGRHGPPRRVIAAALAALAAHGVTVERASAVIDTPPLGPGTRRFANAAALVRTALPPDALLALVKRIERGFGRGRGRRWGDRVLDIDLLVWGGGVWPPRPAAPRDPGASPLRIPHPGLTVRGFALGPAAALAPGWRLPSGITLAQAECRRRGRARRLAPRGARG